MKISVIIPCYNCSETIEKVIDSVVNQTYAVHEIICINDGSTDNTLEILKTLKAKYLERLSINIFNQENSGPSVARNKGIQAAEGDWIAFLDSDDYWLEDKIYRYVKFIEKFPDAKLIASSNLDEPYIKVSFKKLLFKNYFTTSSVLVKRSCIAQHQFDIGKRYAEDYKLWLDITYQNDAYILSPQTAFSLDEVKNKQGFYLGTGLSSKIWEMQKGELLNYYECYKDQKISKLSYITVSGYSSMKFLKRAISVNVNSFLHSKAKIN